MFQYRIRDRRTNPVGVSKSPMGIVIRLYTKCHSFIHSTDFLQVQCDGMSKDCRSRQTSRQEKYHTTEVCIQDV